MMSVEPVRSMFGVVAMNFGAGATEGPQGSEAEGPPAVVNQLSHCPHCRGAQGMENAPQPAWATWIIGIWRANKINQYHLSLQYFWGPCKGQSVCFSSCFLVHEAFTAAVMECFRR